MDSFLPENFLSVLGHWLPFSGQRDLGRGKHSVKENPEKPYVCRQLALFETVFSADSVNIRKESLFALEEGY